MSNYYNKLSEKQTFAVKINDEVLQTVEEFSAKLDDDGKDPLNDKQYFILLHDYALRVREKVKEVPRKQDLDTIEAQQAQIVELQRKMAELTAINQELEQQLTEVNQSLPDVNGMQTEINQLKEVNQTLTARINKNTEPHFIPLVLSDFQLWYFRKAIQNKEVIESFEDFQDNYPGLYAGINTPDEKQNIANYLTNMVIGLTYGLTPIRVMSKDAFNTAWNNYVKKLNA